MSLRLAIALRNFLNILFGFLKDSVIIVTEQISLMRFEKQYAEQIRFSCHVNGGRIVFILPDFLCDFYHLFLVFLISPAVPRRGVFINQDRKGHNKKEVLLPF